jgi:hypothetical protein
MENGTTICGRLTQPNGRPHYYIRAARLTKDAQVSNQIFTILI